MGANILLMLVQYVYGAGIDDAIGYITKRELLCDFKSGYGEREFNVKEKQIILEGILEFAGAIGIIDEFTSLIFENEMDLSDLI